MDSETPECRGGYPIPKAKPKGYVGRVKSQPGPKLAFKEAGIDKDLTLNLQNLAPARFVFKRIRSTYCQLKILSFYKYSNQEPPCFSKCLNPCEKMKLAVNLNCS